MIEKRIAVCIGTDRAGNVRARLSLMLADGDNIISESYHSVSIAPGEDADQIRAAVENHIGMSAEESGVPGSPWPAIPDDEWAKIIGVMNVIQTPDVVLAAVAIRDAAAKANAEIAIQQQGVAIEKIV